VMVLAMSARFLWSPWLLLGTGLSVLGLLAVFACFGSGAG